MNDTLLELISALQAMVILLSAQLAALPAQQSLQSTPSTTPITQGVSAPSTPSFADINTAHKDAVVNILCIGSGAFKGGTATGVIISPTGLVLTNAHMAQYMLLEQFTDAKIDCTVRTGNPAKDAYKADIVYMPPAWIEEHADEILQKEQRGTGEDDYALLQITHSIDRHSPLPQTFPHVTPHEHTPKTIYNQQVLVRAYPAEFLSSQNTIRSLRPVATITTVGDLATFSNESEPNPNIDLISLGGTIVAQGGSSGAAVIDSAARLVGIVVTSTRTEETKDRDLKAITLSHINNSLMKQAGKSLDEILTMSTKDILTKYKAELLSSAHAFVAVYNKD